MSISNRGVVLQKKKVGRKPTRTPIKSRFQTISGKKVTLVLPAPRRRFIGSAMLKLKSKLRITTVDKKLETELKRAIDVAMQKKPRAKMDTIVGDVIAQIQAREKERQNISGMVDAVMKLGKRTRSRGKEPVKRAPRKLANK